MGGGAAERRRVSEDKPTSAEPSERRTHTAPPRYDTERFEKSLPAAVNDLNQPPAPATAFFSVSGSLVSSLISGGAF